MLCFNFYGTKRQWKSPYIKTFYILVLRKNQKPFLRRDNHRHFHEVFCSACHKIINRETRPFLYSGWVATYTAWRKRVARRRHHLHRNYGQHGYYFSIKNVRRFYPSLYLLVKSLYRHRHLKAELPYLLAVYIALSRGLISIPLGVIISELLLLYLRYISQSSCRVI